MRNQSYGIVLLSLLLIATTMGFVSPQNGAGRPLTVDEIKQLWQSEKRGSPNLTHEQVTEHGVVEFDFESEHELRNLGMPQSLIDYMKDHVATGTLTIRCQPVECAVRIDDVSVGTTFGTVLTKSPVKAGSVKVEVSAANFGLQSRIVELQPKQSLTLTFELEAPKGGFSLTCDPADANEQKTMPDCAIHVVGPDGAPKEAMTAQHRWGAVDLPAGLYEISAEAVGYRPETLKVNLNPGNLQPILFKLDADQCARITPLEVFDHIVDSLGGKAVLTVAGKSKNVVQMTLTGDPSTIGMWRAQVVETIAREPNRIRWDLKIAGSSWTVAYDGSTVKSGGNKKYMGTEFAQELEESIRLFSQLRLSSVLATVRGKTDIKHSCTDNEVIMVAESADDRYTFHLNEKDYKPIKLLHEHLTTPHSSQEIEFGQFKKVGEDLILPHLMILRYPSRPKHEHIFVYDSIDLNPRIKDSLFTKP